MIDKVNKNKTGKVTISPSKIKEYNFNTELRKQVWILIEIFNLCKI